MGTFENPKGQNFSPVSNGTPEHTKISNQMTVNVLKKRRKENPDKLDINPHTSIMGSRVLDVLVQSQPPVNSAFQNRGVFTQGWCKKIGICVHLI